LRRIIRAKGGELAATYRIHMPQNSFQKSWENHAKLYSTWKRNIVKVAKNTEERKKGDYFKHFFLAPLFTLIDYIVDHMKPSYRKAFSKLSNAPPDLDMEELIHLNDTSFSVNEKCSGCGICSKVCPVKNIKITNGKPVWLHHCENCLACYNWCPTRAIQGGIAAKGYYYRHPDVRVTEIMEQSVTDRS
jgi:Pyruvate/2-oxoacid:ferredoxin oxidoreductase delta subunit